MTTTTRSRSKLLHQIRQPIERFMHAEASSGILLAVCSVLALVAANTSLADRYFAFLHLTFTAGMGTLSFSTTLLHGINDGLMVVFFFIVGLEIKRELIVGELSTRKKASLPVVGALGGMIMPALLYSILNAGGSGAKGWGIPTATDIAFAVGVVVILGKRVPAELKIFLTALAIADDIGAVLVIAVFYTEALHFTMLAIACSIVIIIFIANRQGVRNLLFYTVSGLVLWIVVLQSGIHATIAGVVLAFVIPVRQRIFAEEFVSTAQGLIDEFLVQTRHKAQILANQKAQSAVRELELACEAVQTPSLRFENNIHTAVAFIIMPLFAFANAGVRFVDSSMPFSEVLLHPVTLGIILGLVFGKPLGITLFCWLGEKLGIVERPAGVSWRDMIAIGCLAGIGFTMSLFVESLAFTDVQLINAGKIGILSASFIAAFAGYLFFTFGIQNNRPS